MALSVRRTALTKVRVITTLVALFALVAQPLYGVVSPDKASAVANTTYSDVGTSGWMTDRATPSGGHGPASFDSRDVLELRVDAPTDAPSSFYRYEGVKKDITSFSTTIKADLYVDEGWPENVRAGFWGVGYNGGSISSYPIIEYNSADSSTNWRLWDSNPGVWREITVPSAANGWNEIELALNVSDNTRTDVYVNGVSVGQTSAAATTDIRAIILNNYNFGTSDYAVRWSNIQTGTYNTDVPANISIAKRSNNTAVSSGTVVDYTDLRIKWGADSKAERYAIRVTDPSGTVQSSRNTATPYFDVDDAVRHGLFGTKEGLWSYDIRTKSVTTGLWSAWSTPVTLTYDSVAPEARIATPASENQLVNGEVLVTGEVDSTEQNMKSHWFEITGPDDYSYSNASGLSKGGNSWSINWDTKNLADGTYKIRYVATDKAGNRSDDPSYTKSVIRTVVVDNSVPTSPKITSPAARSWHKTTPITTTWTSATDANDIAKYQVAYSYDDGHGFGASTCEGVVIGEKTVYCRDATATSRNHSPATAEQGGVTVWVRAFDNAGNPGAWSQSVHYYYDSSAPNVSITAPTGLTGGEFTVSGNAADNLALNRVYVQLINRDNNQRYGGTTINLIARGAATEWSKNYSAKAMNLPDGTYAAHASVTDMAGNTSTAGWTDNFEVDSSNPTISVSMSDTLINKTEENPTLSVTVADKHSGVAYTQYKIMDTQSETVRDWKTITGTSDEVDVTDLNGDYTLRARTYDNAGNKKSGADVAFTVDKIAPSIQAGLYDPIAKTLTFTTDDTDVTDVTLEVDGEDVEPAMQGADNTVWVFDVSDFNTPDTTYSYTATATDAAGNFSVTDRVDDGETVLQSFTVLATMQTPGDVAIDEDEEQTSGGTLDRFSETLVAFSPVNTPAPIFGASNNFSTFGNPVASDFTDDTDDAAILGAKDSNKSNESTSSANTVAAIEPSADGWKIFGAAWYWWLLAIAAVAGAWWWIALAKRRSDNA